MILFLIGLAWEGLSGDPEVVCNRSKQTCKRTIAGTRKSKPSNLQHLSSVGATLCGHWEVDSIEQLKGQLKGPSIVCILGAPKVFTASRLLFFTGDAVSQRISAVGMLFLCHYHYRPRKNQSRVI